MIRNNYTKHYEDSILIPATKEEIFEYVDDHSHFSSHMSQSSWMMGGGHMDIEIDDGKGQKVGSHIRLHGRVFGIHLFLDEIIMLHEPPYRKVWQTVGDIQLLIIGHYQMGLEISEIEGKSKLKVFIDYELPSSQRWLGYLFGKFYARWCVKQMLETTLNHFTH